MSHTNTHSQIVTTSHTHTYIIYALYKCVKLAAYEKELKYFEKN